MSYQGPPPGYLPAANQQQSSASNSAAAAMAQQQVYGKQPGAPQYAGMQNAYPAAFPTHPSQYSRQSYEMGQPPPPTAPSAYAYAQQQQNMHPQQQQQSPYGGAPSQQQQQMHHSQQQQHSSMPPPQFAGQMPNQSNSSAAGLRSMYPPAAAGGYPSTAQSYNCNSYMGPPPPQSNNSNSSQPASMNYGGQPPPTNPYGQASYGNSNVPPPSSHSAVAMHNFYAASPQQPQSQSYSYAQAPQPPSAAAAALHQPWQHQQQAAYLNGSSAMPPQNYRPVSQQQQPPPPPTSSYSTMNDMYGGYAPAAASQHTYPPPQQVMQATPSQQQQQQHQQLMQQQARLYANGGPPPPPHSSLAQQQRFLSGPPPPQQSMTSNVPPAAVRESMQQAFETSMQNTVSPAPTFNSGPQLQQHSYGSMLPPANAGPRFAPPSHSQQQQPLSSFQLGTSPPPTSLPRMMQTSNDNGAAPSAAAAAAGAAQPSSGMIPPPTLDLPQLPPLITGIGAGKHMPPKMPSLQSPVTAASPAAAANAANSTSSSSGSHHSHHHSGPFSPPPPKTELNLGVGGGKVIPRNSPLPPLASSSGPNSMNGEILPKLSSRPSSPSYRSQQQQQQSAETTLPPISRAFSHMHAQQQQHPPSHLHHHPIHNTFHASGYSQPPPPPSSLTDAAPSLPPLLQPESPSSSLHGGKAPNAWHSYPPPPHASGAGLPPPVLLPPVPMHPGLAGGNLYSMPPPQPFAPGDLYGEQGPPDLGFSAEQQYQYNQQQQQRHAARRNSRLSGNIMKESGLPQLMPLPPSSSPFSSESAQVSAAQPKKVKPPKVPGRGRGRPRKNAVVPGAESLMSPSSSAQPTTSEHSMPFYDEFTGAPLSQQPPQSAASPKKPRGRKPKAQKSDAESSYNDDVDSGAAEKAGSSFSIVRSPAFLEPPPTLPDINYDAVELEPIGSIVVQPPSLLSDDAVMPTENSGATYILAPPPPPLMIDTGSPPFISTATGDFADSAPASNSHVADAPDYSATTAGAADMPNSDTSEFVEPSPKRPRRPVKKSKKAEAADATDAAAATFDENFVYDENDDLAVTASGRPKRASSGRKSKSKKAAASIDDNITDADLAEQDFDSTMKTTARGRRGGKKSASKNTAESFDLTETTTSSSSHLFFPPPPISSGGPATSDSSAVDADAETSLGNSSSYLNTSQASLDELVPKKKNRGRSPRRKPGAGSAGGGAVTTKFQFGKRKRKRLGSDDEDEDDEVKHSSRTTARESSAAATDAGETLSQNAEDADMLLSASFADKRRSTRNAARKHYDADAELDEQLEKLARLSDDETTSSARKRSKKKAAPAVPVAENGENEEPESSAAAELVVSDAALIDNDASLDSGDDDDTAAAGGGGARPGRMSNVIVEKILASRVRMTTLRQLTVERRELEEKRRKQEVDYFAKLEGNESFTTVDSSISAEKQKNDADDAVVTATEAIKSVVSDDAVNTRSSIQFSAVVVRSNITEYGSSLSLPAADKKLDSAIGESAAKAVAIANDVEMTDARPDAVINETTKTDQITLAAGDEAVAASADADLAKTDTIAAVVTSDESTIISTAAAAVAKPDENTTNSDEFDADDDIVQSITEYFIKYKGLSFLHCEWRTADELEEDDPRFPGKLKRWQQKKEREGAQFADDEDEPFNPDFVEIDRVLDERQLSDPERPSDDRKLTYYLVKWEALSYDDSTWEKAFNVPEQKIAEFRARNRYDAAEMKAKKVPRPPASRWRKLPTSEMVYKNDNILRDYQEVGVNWLLYCWHNKQNCILADEMGLGKTVQSVTYLEHISRYRIRGPFLVVVPLSTIGNWKREVEGWTDLNGIVYHGTSTSRDIIREFEMFYRNPNDGKPIPGAAHKFNVFITTYEILLTDIFELQEIEWRVCIIDEAHRLKNKKCKLIQGLNLLKVEHRVLLTGTPLQNNVEELYNLLNFLEPERFSSSEEFLLEFGNLHSDEQVRKLQAILKPMMLRRMKEDVEKSIAPKEETIVEVELTNIQKKYYRAILERNFSFLVKGTKSNANLPNLMNTMMELRKCCNHPFLINGAEEQVLEEFRAAQAEKRAKNLATELEDPQMHMDAMVQASGKLVLVDKLLPKLHEGGHKVLIFSQMVRVLDILEDYLAHRGYLYERLDGRVRGIDRQAAIDRFSRRDSDRFVFLLCTRAGGLGINLTAADTVVIYDSDWNPQNDLQAQARCHRIGQEKFVKIYRLITRNSYEREMFDKASLKLGLDKAVLQSMSGTGGGGPARAEGSTPLAGSGGKTSGGQAQLSKADIEDLLKKGAYGALMEDDNAADKFCEEDIEQILSRRAHVVKIESGIAGSTFSKASFSTAGTEMNIDINDPDFWDKWAKKADVNTEPAAQPNAELIIYGSRSRKQTRRYHETLQHEQENMPPSDADELAAGELPMSIDEKGRVIRHRKSSKFSGDESDDALSAGGQIRPGSWVRGECHKMERFLMTFGWGRWEPIADEMRRGGSRRAAAYTDRDAEIFCRTILHYCIKSYTSDFATRLEILMLLHRSFLGDENAAYPTECVQPDHLLEPPSESPFLAKNLNDEKEIKNDAEELGTHAGVEQKVLPIEKKAGKNAAKSKKSDKKANGADAVDEADNGKKRRKCGAGAGTAAGKRRGGKKSRRAASISEEDTDEDSDDDEAGSSSSSDSSNVDSDDDGDNSGKKKKRKRGGKSKKSKSNKKSSDAAAEEEEKENLSSSSSNKYVHPQRPKWELDPSWNPAELLHDESYRRHLEKYTVRTLQRVRLLQFVHATVIGKENAQLILGNLPASAIPMKQPDSLDVGEPPVPWWNEECDKSLVIGIYKHGYERYNDMIADRCLVFRELMTAYAAQNPQTSNMQSKMVETIKTELDTSAVDAETPDKLEGSEEKSSKLASSAVSADFPLADVANTDNGPPQPVFIAPLTPFPSNADMNTRMKRYQAAYQRLLRREDEQLMKLAVREQRLHRIAERREAKKVELAQKKWSRREENEFFRLVTTYGIGYRRPEQIENDESVAVLDYDWDIFRQRSKNLDKKLDKTLTEYFAAYNAMCRQVCGKSLTQDEESLLTLPAVSAVGDENVPPVACEAISEDKARKAMQRTELLQRIHRALQHSRLNERLALCELTHEMPVWWISGKHDKALLEGIAKHGFLQMNQLIFHDPESTFYALFHPTVETTSTLVHGADFMPPKVENVADSEAVVAAVKLEDLPSTLDDVDVLPSLEENSGTVETRQEISETFVEQAELSPSTPLPQAPKSPSVVVEHQPSPVAASAKNEDALFDATFTDFVESAAMEETLTAVVAVSSKIKNDDVIVTERSMSPTTPEATKVESERDGESVAAAALELDEEAATMPAAATSPNIPSVNDENNSIDMADDDIDRQRRSKSLSPLTPVLERQPSKLTADFKDESVDLNEQVTARKISSSLGESVTLVVEPMLRNGDDVSEQQIEAADAAIIKPEIAASDEAVEPAPSESALLLERQLNSAVNPVPTITVTVTKVVAKRKRNRGSKQQQSALPPVFQHFLLQCDPSTDDDVVIDVKLTLLNLLDDVCSQFPDADVEKATENNVVVEAETVKITLENPIEATRESAALAAAAAAVAIEHASSAAVYLWPRDKTILNRLEDVLYTVEQGQWPSTAVRNQLRRRENASLSAAAAAAAASAFDAENDASATENDDEMDENDADDFERDYSEDPPSSTYSSQQQQRRRSSFAATFTDAVENGREHLSPLFGTADGKNRISSNKHQQQRQLANTASFFGGGAVMNSSSSNAASSASNNNVAPFFITQNINNNEISFLGVPSSEANVKQIKRRKTSAVADTQQQQQQQQQPVSPNSIALQLAQSIAAFQIPVSSSQQQVMSNNAASALELSLLNMSNKVNELSLDEQRQLYEEFLETYVREQASLKKKMRPARRGRRSNAEIEQERLELQQEAHNAFIKQFGNLPGMLLANTNKLAGASSAAAAAVSRSSSMSQQQARPQQQLATNSSATANDLLMMATQQQLQQLLELAALQQHQNQQDPQQQQQQQSARQQNESAAAAASSTGKRGGRRGRRPRIDAAEPGSNSSCAQTSAAAPASSTSNKQLTQQQVQQQQQEQLLAAVLAAATQPAGTATGNATPQQQQQLLLQQQLQQIGFQEQQAVELAQLHTVLGPALGGMLVQTAVAELTTATAAAAAAASSGNPTTTSAAAGMTAAQLQQQQQQQAIQLLLAVAASGGNSAGGAGDDWATQMLRLTSEQQQQQQQQQQQKPSSPEKLTFARPGDTNAGASVMTSIVKRRKAVRDTGGSSNKQQPAIPLTGAAAHFFSPGINIAAANVAAEQPLPPTTAGGRARGSKLHKKLDNLFKTKAGKTDVADDGQKTAPIPRKRRSRLSVASSSSAATALPNLEMPSKSTKREQSADDANDEHVPVMNMHDGTMLTGRKAPLKANISEFLQQNPLYIVLDNDAAAKLSGQRTDVGQQSQPPPPPQHQQQRRRKRGGSPTPAVAQQAAEQKLQQQQLTGNEHVVVVHRITRQRLTGSEAPTLKQLGEWLEQHPEYDVDAEWVALIHAAAAASTTNDANSSTVAVNTSISTAATADDRPLKSETSKQATEPSAAAATTDAENSAAAAAALVSFQQQLNAMSGVSASNKSTAELMLKEAEALAALTNAAAAANKQNSAVATRPTPSSSATATTSAAAAQQQQDPMAAISDALMAALMSSGGASAMFPGMMQPTQAVASTTSSTAPSFFAVSATNATAASNTATTTSAITTTTSSSAAQKQQQQLQQQQQEMDMLTQLLFGQIHQQQQQQQQQQNQRNQQNQQAAALAALYAGIPTSTATSQSQSTAALQQQQMLMAAQFAQLAGAGGMPGLSVADLNMLGLGMPTSSAASTSTQQQQQQQQQQAALLQTMMMLGGGGGGAGANASGGMSAGSMDAFLAAMLTGQPMPTNQSTSAAESHQRSASRASSSKDALISGTLPAAKESSRKRKTSASKRQQSASNTRQPTIEPALAFATPEPTASAVAGGGRTPSTSSSTAGTPGLKAAKTNSTPTPQQQNLPSSSFAFPSSQPSTSVSSNSLQLYALAQQQQQQQQQQAAAAAAAAACGLNPFAGLPASVLAAFGLPPTAGATSASSLQQMNGAAAALFPGVAGGAALSLESLQNAAALEQLFGMNTQAAAAAFGMQLPSLGGGKVLNADMFNGIAGTSSAAAAAASDKQTVPRKRGPGRPPKSATATADSK